MKHQTKHFCIVFLQCAMLIQEYFCLENLNLNPKKILLEDDCKCEWSAWMNNNDYSPLTGDNNTYDNLRKDYEFCSKPRDIECRSILNPKTSFHFHMIKGVKCDVSFGLLCNTVLPTSNHFVTSGSFYCEDYEIRVDCCKCPQDNKSTPWHLQNIYSNLTDSTMYSLSNTTLLSPTTQAAQADSISLGIPLSLIIVIAIAAILILGIVVCVIVTHKEKKTKVIFRNLEGDSYLQRPVSFTDVDLMKRFSNSSSNSGVAENAQIQNYHYTELNNVKMELLSPGHDDEPDVVSSTKQTNHSSITPYATDERRWLPDEYEKQMELQPVKAGKKSLFSKSVVSIPPQPPVVKSVAFPDDSK